MFVFSPELRSKSHCPTSRVFAALPCEVSHTCLPTIFHFLPSHGHPTPHPSPPRLPHLRVWYYLAPLRSSHKSLDGCSKAYIEPAHSSLVLLFLPCPDGCQLLHLNDPMVLLPTSVTGNSVANMTLQQPH